MRKRRNYKWSDRPFWKRMKEEARRRKYGRNYRGAGRKKIDTIECTCNQPEHHTSKCRIYQTLYQRRRREKQRLEQESKQNRPKYIPIKDLDWLPYGILPLTPKQMERARKANFLKKPENNSEKSADTS